MKSKIVLTVSLFAGLIQVAAATQVDSYPVQPVLDSLGTGSPVALYFGDAAHPPVASHKGEVTKSVRIARKVDGREASCKTAFADGINQLRTYAQDHGASGVINISTRFHGTKTNSATEFVCATSMSAAALKISGELVTFETN